MKGIGVETNIKPFLIKEFEKTKSDADRPQGDGAISIVKLMIANSHISTYIELYQLKWENFIESETKLDVQLTYLGSDYFSSEVLAKRTIRNFTWSRWLTIGALCVSGYSLWYASHENNGRDTKLEHLEIQVKYLQSQGKTQSVSIPIKIDTIHLSAQKKP